MSFEELLKTLQKDYLESLPSKVTHIQKQISAGSPRELRESFHKLKGTGRTYGLPEVSELAAVVEEVCTKTPHEARFAASLAASILRDIHAARLEERDFDLQSHSLWPKLTHLATDAG